jgi:phosphoribosylformylglycinamidine synthase I
MRFAVVVFPGSNCDADAARAVENVVQQPVEMVWHRDTDLERFDCIILPGGFSYGDYLRSGAIARFSPVMNGVRKAVDDGRLVIGICNGFQILLEAGLLPGAMRHNDSLQFRCEMVTLEVASNDTPFTRLYQEGEKVRIPIAHGEGNYFADADTLRRMRENRQIVFRYHGYNPNGSVDHIAAICNETRNVLGMMPHPERAVDPLLGSTDGRRLFLSIVEEWMVMNGAK